MYSINSLMGNSSSSSGSSSKAVGGMATGLDTAELIKGMTSSTRLKIAKQKQTKQLLAWQTDSYRGVSNKLIEFSKKYTSFASSTNLLSSSFYTKTDISTSGVNADKVAVSGSSAMTDNISIVSAEKASEGGAISTLDASNKVLTGTTVDLSDPISSLSGKKMTIAYDGNNYEIAFDATKYADITEVNSAINAKLGAVDVIGEGGQKLSDVVEFSLNSGKVKIENKSADKSVTFSNFDSGLKTTLGFDFQTTDLSIASSNSVTAATTNGALTKDLSTELAEKSIRFSFNNTEKNISFSKSELDVLKAKPGGIDANLTTLLQTKLDSAFGKDAVTVSKPASKLEFKTSNTGAVFKVAAIDSRAQEILGLNVGDSNRLNINTKLSDVKGMSGALELSIDGGDPHPFAANATIKDLQDFIKNSGKNIEINYVESLDRFEFKSTGELDVELSGNIKDKIFGNNTASNPAAPLIKDKFIITKPSEAKLSIKYGSGSTIDLTSNNNTFNIDGLTINVNESFAALSGDVKLSSATDTNKVISAVKDMVKDYNDIVDLVNKEYSTKQNRNYPPLTDEQRKDMSESEIKAWEDKAKTGLLFGNSDLSALSSDLRSVFFSNKENMAALNELGITSSTNWKDNGKILINEEKLKKAIENDPENVKNLLSKPLENKKDTLGNDILVNGKTVIDYTSGGVMARLKNLTDKYSKTEGSTKGILIEKAGNVSAPLSITKNYNLDRMNNIDTLIKNLNRTLATEEKRYQRQFTTLETAYSKINAQSGWLQQFGG